MSNDVKILFNNHALVGEGALWDEEQGVLYWVDILSNKLYIYDPGSG